MPQPPTPPPPPPNPPSVAPAPARPTPFDPWNSSSTGHQRAENRLGASTGWRDSRNAKLLGQFRGGASGGLGRVSDKLGAGSQDYDPGMRALVTPEARARAKNSVADMLARPGTMKRLAAAAAVKTEEKLATSQPGAEKDDHHHHHQQQQQIETKEEEEEEEEEEAPPPKRRIFDGVVVYVNGSTHPLVSDHRLKQLLAEHGARLSVHLSQRKVTHVIIGRPASGRGGGAGGGLAGGKLQKEIQKKRAGGGSGGVKFVDAEWVLESVKAGKRLSEARFGTLKIASKGQQSVFGLYSSEKEKERDRKEESAAAAQGAESSASGRPPNGRVLDVELV